MSVSLLLPLRGENNGTVFQDYSPSPKTITRYGNTKTVTEQSKYYGSSGYFDGAGDYLETPAHDGFSFGSDDFTVEFWAFPTAWGSGGSNSIATNRTSSIGWMALIGPSIFNCNLWSSSGVLTQVSGKVTNAINEWAHFAMCRQGGTVFLSKNGEIIHDQTASLIIGVGSALRVGADTAGATYNHTGYLQDLRVTKGLARYKSNFTPPGALIGSVSGTIRDRNGNPCQRKVYAVSRPTDTTAPQILAHGLSDATTGAYELAVPTDEEVTRVVVSEDDDPLLNDLVDRVIPA